MGKIDLKIQQCINTIKWLLITIGVFGSGIGATVNYSDLIIKLFSETSL